MSRLPIFHDDRSFHEQTERMFREMQEKIGFHHPPPNPAANVNVFRDFVAGGWPPAMDDHAFFQLQPSTTMTRQDVGRGPGLQSEVLDDATARSLFVDLDPQKGQGQGRVFRMSFDARQYDPAEVSVRCEDGCLVVEAKHVELDGSASKEFQRRIQLPADVDPSKLTSTLSTDGILTVEAPVPPRYQAVVGPATETRPPNGSGRVLSTSTVQARSSPVTVRLEPSTGRSRSPFLDSARGGRQSPFSGSNALPVASNGAGFMPRNSPIPFASMMHAPNGGGIDVPVFTADPVTGRRRLELLLDLGRPYTADDVVVRVDGRRLTVDARHEATDQQGRVSTSTTQKQFDVDEQLDATTVTATMRDDGRLVVAGLTKQ